MQDLIDRLSQATGLDAQTTQNAVATILVFLQKEGPPDEVGQLIDSMPGAAEAMQNVSGGGSRLGGILGMFGGAGGVMALGTQLMGQGLSFDQVTTLGKELFAYGREHAGEDTVGAIVGQIPGLSQFI